ncbi:MAG: PKD domain-containing protein [Deltaproteobacteria bacterium]|nr:PKD domain-containing protein [Deltaproteobacteria bacterium]
MTCSRSSRKAGLPALRRAAVALSLPALALGAWALGCSGEESETGAPQTGSSGGAGGTSGCTAGASEACDNCGTRTCGADGTWGECQGQGECAAGAQESSACEGDGTQVRSCSETCAWSEPGPCVRAVARVGESEWYAQEKETRYAGAELTAYYVPLPVFFEGWESGPAGEIVDYRWDFGDGSPVFQGFNAAHVYEQPGAYTATLSVEHVGGATDVATVVIEARARDGQTYYVDAVDGEDDNDGLSEKTAWQTATHALGGMTEKRYAPGDAILFKRGQTFLYGPYGGTGDAVAPVDPGKATYGYLFGAFGAGDKPILTPTGGYTGGVVRQTGRGLAHVAFQDLVFDGVGEAASVYFVGGAAAINILFHRVDIRNTYRGAVVSGGEGTEPDRVVSGFFFLDSTIENTTETELYAVAQRVAIVGSRFDHAGNHLNYLSWLDAAVISDNLYSRPPFGRHALRICGNSCAHPSRNVYVARNEIRGWLDPETEGDTHAGGGTRYNWLLVHLAPNTATCQATENLLFERNVVTNGEALINVGSAEGVVVRNNLLASATGRSIVLGSLHGFDQRPSKNIALVGNTVVLAASSAPAFELRGYKGPPDPPVDYDQHQQIVLRNNLLHLVGASGRAVEIKDADDALRSQLDIDHNLYFLTGGSASSLTFVNGASSYSFAQWQADTGWDAAGLFGDPQLTSPLGPDGELGAEKFDSDLRLLPASPAIGAGSVVPVHSVFDFAGSRRLKDGSVDIGAYEHASGD